MKTLYLIIRSATTYACNRRALGSLFILLLLSITACEPDPEIDISPTENKLRTDATQSVITNDTDKLLYRNGYHLGL